MLFLLHSSFLRLHLSANLQPLGKLSNKGGEPFIECKFDFESPN